MNVLNCWIEKYGKEKADKMWEERNQKVRETHLKRSNKMSSEEKKRLYGRPGEQNGAFGKSVEDFWIEKYGKETAHEMWLEHINRISETSMGTINLGDKNGMKSPEARAKASATRKELFKDPEFMQRHIDMTKKAWADGKYDGVKVGRCKWYDYKLQNGETVKVQGKWELAYVKYLDKNNIKFKCHRGRIPYVSNGEEHSYYPDFYLIDSDEYIDVKNDYHWNLQKEKFDNINSFCLN